MYSLNRLYLAIQSNIFTAQHPGTCSPSLRRNGTSPTRLASFTPLEHQIFACLCSRVQPGKKRPELYPSETRVHAWNFDFVISGLSPHFVCLLVVWPVLTHPQAPISIPAKTIWEVYLYFSNTWPWFNSPNNRTSNTTIDKLAAVLVPCLHSSVVCRCRKRRSPRNGPGSQTKHLQLTQLPVQKKIAPFTPVCTVEGPQSCLPEA